MILKPEDCALFKPKKNLLLKMNNYSLKEEIVFEKESDFHNLKVVKSEIGKFLKYQDTYQAGFIDTPYYKGNLPYINYFLIPYLMNKNIKDILFIGFGSGLIINQYEELFLNLKRIDIVDIEENIFDIAKSYFDFKDSKKYNYHLQDAMIFLRSIKKKYDLIVVDVAGNDGIDERFLDIEYLQLIKSHLKKVGIFVSNLPSSRDIFNKKNKVILNLIDNYTKTFKAVDIYNGEMSNRVFYKTFFDMDEIVLDITNLILISSDKEYKIMKDFSKIENLNVDIEKYLKDKI